MSEETIRKLTAELAAARAEIILLQARLDALNPEIRLGAIQMEGHHIKVAIERRRTGWSRITFDFSNGMRKATGEKLFGVLMDDHLLGIMEDNGKPEVGFLLDIDGCERDPHHAYWRRPSSGGAVGHVIVSNPELLERVVEALQTIGPHSLRIDVLPE